MGNLGNFSWPEVIKSRIQKSDQAERPGSIQILTDHMALTPVWIVPHPAPLE